MCLRPCDDPVEAELEDVSTNTKHLHTNTLHNHNSRVVLDVALHVALDVQDVTLRVLDDPLCVTLNAAPDVPEDVFLDFVAFVALDVVVYGALHVLDILDVLDAVLHVALDVLGVVLDLLVGALNAFSLCRRRFLTRMWMLVSEVCSPSSLEM